MRTALARFARNRLALAGAMVLLGLVALVALTPLLYPGDPFGLVGPALQPPGGQFLLGTDTLGRDVAAEIAYGARTSLIIGDDRSKQVTLALDLTTGRRPGALFTDEIRCPVHVDDLAAATVELAGSDYAGILNVAGPEAISRADFGRLVARRFGLDPGTVPTGRLADADLGPRAAEVRLDVTRAQRLLTATLRPVTESLR